MTQKNIFKDSSDQYVSMQVTHYDKLTETLSQVGVAKNGMCLNDSMFPYVTQISPSFAKKSSQMGEDNPGYHGKTRNERRIYSHV